MFETQYNNAGKWRCERNERANLYISLFRNILPRKKKNMTTDKLFFQPSFLPGPPFLRPRRRLPLLTRRLRLRHVRVLGGIPGGGGYHSQGGGGGGQVRRGRAPGGHPDQGGGYARVAFHTGFSRGGGKVIFFLLMR